MNIQNIVRNRFKFNLFLLTKLPLAWIIGLKVISVDSSSVRVMVKQRYITKNPFNSIYFAVLAMAGEFASGLLAMIHLYASNKSVSMLVVSMEAFFVKKAVGKIIFTCEGGQTIRKAINYAINTGESMEVFTNSKGFDENGDLVAEFKIVWSFKLRKSKEIVVV